MSSRDPRKLLVDNEVEIAQRFERIQADLLYLVSLLPPYSSTVEQLKSANTFVQGSKVHVNSLIVIAKNSLAK